MGECFIVRRGGGIGSKTKISNITSETDLPESAKQGAIAIVSDIDINDIYVQVDQPDPVETGDVWVVPNLSSTTMYTIGSAKIPFSMIWQYNGSEWVRVTYYRYDGNAWVSCNMYLLNGSIDTGTEWSIYTAYAGTAYATESGYTIIGENGGNQPAAIQTSHKVDLTGFSKLYCFGKNDNQMEENFPFTFGIQPSAAYQDDAYDGIYVISGDSTASTVYNKAGEFTLCVDISNYTGLYYVGCSSAHENSYIYQIWLEV